MYNISIKGPDLRLLAYFGFYRVIISVIGGILSRAKTLLYVGDGGCISLISTGMMHHWSSTRLAIQRRACVL